MVFIGFAFRDCKMVDETSEIRSAPRFYYEPYVDLKQRLRTKISCAIELPVSDESGEETFVAYGAAVCSFQDEYSIDAGKSIAQKRAEKVLGAFKDMGHDISYTNWLLAHSDASLHQEMFTAEDFTSLEKELLPFDKASVWREMPAKKQSIRDSVKKP